MLLMIEQWASAIFRYAVATPRADTDRAAALNGAIHRLKTEHRKPLSREQIADFAKALYSYGGYRTTAIALRLMLVTFVRTVELRAARTTLAHAQRNKVRASYNQAEYLADRGAMMQHWADMADTMAQGGHKVQALRRTA